MNNMRYGTSFEYKLKPGGIVEDSTGLITKSSSGSAEVIVDTIQPNNNGSLDGVIYANVRNVHNNRCGDAVAFSNVGIYNITYWSGNGIVGNGYKLTMQTQSSSSVGVTVTGVFSP